jgi:phosphoribosyl-ATP pyrophosphohydrolase
MSATEDRLSKLEATIRNRMDTGDPASSYVASLAAKGRGKIAQKLGEEAVETVIAALEGDRDGDGDVAGLTSEAADLVFHLTVLLAHADVRWADVLTELERREGQSGLTEKAARPKT